LRHSALVFWTITLTTVAVDQGSKALVRSQMVEGTSREFVSGVLDLTFVRNTGAAFGLFPGFQPVFIATSVVVLIVIALYWRRSRPSAWPLVVALGLIAGGALGNLIDRALIGRVTDMFEFAFVEFPVFNVADMAIIVGVAILILWLLLVPDPQLASQEDAAQDASAPGDSTRDAPQ